MKGKKLIIPKKETEFLNPTLRENEWIFAHNFMRILERRLKQDAEDAKDKRRAALSENDKK